MRVVLFLVMVVGLSVVLAWAGAGAGEQKSGDKKSSDSKASDSANSRFDYAELSKAPEKARARRNPLSDDETAVAGGKKLFEQHCAECHGASAEGGKKAPSLLVPEVQDATPGAVFWVLTNGVVRRGMPVWSKLPEPQRWQLVTYLRTLKSGNSKISLP